MTVGDLIKNKDYDYISWRITLPKSIVDKCDEDSVFIGSCFSKNGKLIFNGNDTDYYEDEVVIKYEEWTRPDKDIENGSTVWVEGDWYESGV